MSLHFHQTNPPSLQISEKEEIRNVTLTSTIPIVCDHNYTCCLTVKLDVDGPKSKSHNKTTLDNTTHDKITPGYTQDIE